MKVFLGLGDICGYYSQLEEGLIAIGVDCTFVNAFPSIQYPRRTRPPLLGAIVEALAVRRAAAARGTLKRRSYTVLQAFWMGLLFLWSLFTCRAYVFSGGISFLPPFDLWILRLLGKRVIIVFHGSDARPPYLNGSVPCSDPDDVKQCIALAARMKHRLVTIERHADVIVNHVLSSQFHERRIVGWLNLGIPYDTARYDPADVPDRDETVVVHAPTRPGPKGSALIEAAIERLQARGYAIRFVKLVGRPNSEVLDALKTCDFVVDELFSDTTMASFATEAAAFGKPAIVGVHGFDVLRGHTAPGMLPPAFVCAPSEVEAAIERLIVDRELRHSLGQRARRFVASQWSPARVAERYRALLDGSFPDDWYFSPGEVRYVHGWGLSDPQLRQRVSAVIRAGGLRALQLTDKPAVEQAVVELASAANVC